MRQPCGLLTTRTSLKTRLPCAASSGSLEDRMQVMKPLRPERCPPAHACNSSDHFPSGAGTLLRRLSRMLGTQRLPIRSGSSASVLRACVVCTLCTHAAAGTAHQLEGVQQAVWRCPSSLLSHSSLPRVSLPSSGVVSSQPVSRGCAVQYET